MEDTMLNIDELHELAANRRSIRGYDKAKPVSDEAVRKILDCARWAPSGGNGQPWEFIVIRDEKTRYQIADISSSNKNIKGKWRWRCGETPK